MIIKITIVILLILSFYKVNFAQKQEDLSWVNKHFFSVLKELMPVDNPKYSISYRSYRDLYTDELETSFVITKNWRDGKISAKLLEPDGESIYDQIRFWHQQNPNETIENIKKKIKINESTFDESSCSSINKQFVKFYRESLPKFAEITKKSEIYTGEKSGEVNIFLHPKIHTINADFSDGNIEVNSPDKDNLFVIWANETYQILKNCKTKK